MESESTVSSSKFDIVIFGATGFTGQFVVEYVANTIEEEGGLTWAIAGRSMAKLQNCLKVASKQTGKELEELPIIISDVSSPQSLIEMCKQAKMVLNCVGPYRFYGDAVVRACIETGTHHLDISGEPGFLEKVQLLYNEKAKEAGCYIVGSCGWDSIPAEMGVSFTQKQATGDLNSVEGYVAMHSGPEGGAGHFGTWQSAIYGFAHQVDTNRQRKLLYTTPMLKPQDRLQKRGAIFGNPDVGGWSLPFPGSDKSVVYRTQRYRYEVKKERPIQFNAFFALPNIFTVAGMVIMGLMFGTLASFKCGRWLLEKFPKLFSFGVFSHEGPTRKQMAGTSFTYTFIGQAYSTKLDNPEDQHTDKPDHKIITKVTGPELGYISTPVCLVESAYTIFAEKDKIPNEGGVYTPGAMFEDTELINRLEKHNIKFSVVQK